MSGYKGRLAWVYKGKLMPPVRSFHHDSHRARALYTSEFWYAR